MLKSTTYSELANVFRIVQQVHGGAPGMSTPYLTSFSLPEEIVPPGTKAFPVMATSHTKVSEPIKAVEPVRGPNTSHGQEALPHHARPLEYVTRTFVPGEQLRVNIERDRRLEEGTAAQVLVRCRIISPNWWRSWSSTAPARRKGTYDVKLGSWKREGIQYKKNGVSAFFLVEWYLCSR
ncbi:hypothetical protein IGI04_035577 [Brassica rapa subsp. trilocularis]|uniref:Uncharacterized protein n=1 Tax=Brassica rapa subsp. trilocularis TaxID=1813537 RepID=A0ABQ7LC14_BRACM|nr:hypothetical protein IGI04_035577 [Brassica rapa subsp. trilocularis]